MLTLSDFLAELDRAEHLAPANAVAKGSTRLVGPPNAARMTTPSSTPWCNWWPTS